VGEGWPGRTEDVHNAKRTRPEANPESWLGATRGTLGRVGPVTVEGSALPTHPARPSTVGQAGATTPPAGQYTYLPALL
jgi:hypothetical protein